MGIPTGSVELPSSPPPQPPRPPVPPYTAPPPAPEEFEDAPPSYEDAMADALGPVDGPRREYNPLDAAVSGNSAQTGTDTQGSVSDFKEDRLFPNSGPLNVSTDSFDAYNQRNTTDTISGSIYSTLSPSTAQRASDSSWGSRDQTRPDSQLTELVDLSSEWSPRVVSPQFGIPNRKPVPGTDTSSQDTYRASR